MSWTLRFHVWLCVTAGVATASLKGSAQLVVSEASAGGGDWVEVRNDGPDAVNLDGHHLLDNLDDADGVDVWTGGPRRRRATCGAGQRRRPTCLGRQLGVPGG